MDAPLPSSPRLSPKVWPVLVGAATFVAFLPALRGEFLIWDDDLNFLGNPNYRGLGWSNLKWMWTTFLMGHWHPLTWMTLGLDYVIWGMNPVGYHLTSLLFHTANAVLLYFVLAAFLRLAGREELSWPAALGALFYAVHPLRVESVAWITERRDVLCGFFTLLAVLAYLKRVEEERAGRPAMRWLVLAVAAFGASLLSKALAITLPAVLLLLDLYPLGRFKPGARRRILFEKAPFLILSALDAAVMLFAMRHIEAVHAVADYNLLARVAQAAYGLCFYVAKTLWPFHLIPIYPIETHLDPTRPVYLAAMAGVAAVTGALIALRRRRPEGLTTWVGYAVLVSPVLGIAVTGMQIAADRYTYLAMIPASVLLAAGLRSRAAGAAVGALVFVLALLTGRQCLVWHDTESLWTREIEHQPGLYLPYASRAVGRLSHDDLDGAIADFDASIAINPVWQASLAGRAGARATKGDPRGAIEDFTRAIQIDPKYSGAYAGRALSRSRLGDVAGALADCAEALRLEPGLPVAIANRGIVRQESGDHRGAIADFSQALEKEPAAALLYRSRGRSYAELKKYPEAIADFNRALELQPGHLDTLARRALACTQSGNPQAALRDYNEILNRQPDAAAYSRRAGVRGMLGDLAGVEADATEALRLKPDLYEAYLFRADARMNRGDREGAIQDFAKALELAPPSWPRRKQAELFLQELRRPK